MSDESLLCHWLAATFWTCHLTLLTVFVCSGCHNKISLVGCLKQQTCIFLIVLETGVQVPSGLVSGEDLFLTSEWTPSLCPHVASLLCILYLYHLYLCVYLYLYLYLYLCLIYIYLYLYLYPYIICIFIIYLYLYLYISIISIYLYISVISIYLSIYLEKDRYLDYLFLFLSGH